MHARSSTAYIIATLHRALLVEGGVRLLGSLELELRRSLLILIGSIVAD